LAVWLETGLNASLATLADNVYVGPLGYGELEPG